MINPAIAGTKRLLDVRLNYRMQWVGYADAPKTTSISAHSRFLKGKMGAGMYFMQDQVGPAKQTNFGAAYAYHIRFPDCELSAGLSGNFEKYRLIGSKILLHNTQDPAIDQTITDQTWVADAAFGIYLYNDRFHFGVSALRAFGSEAEFYKNDTTKEGLVKFVQHAYMTLGYNYSQNPDFVWENTVYANYVKGAPFMLDYTLRLHYRQQVMAGVSIRLRDAIALHVGYTFLEDFQATYSYDLQIGKLRGYNKGSHEIMLVCSTNIFTKKNRGVSDRFLHQKYGYLF